MAILWSRQIAGVNYQVRTAGQTRRLYTDGVFHSQYHPGRMYTGGVWDLLMMPALFYGSGHIKYSGDIVKGKIQLNATDDNEGQKRFNAYVSGFRIGSSEQVKLQMGKFD